MRPTEEIHLEDTITAMMKRRHRGTIDRVLIAGSEAIGWRCVKVLPIKQVSEEEHNALLEEADGVLNDMIAAAKLASKEPPDDDKPSKP